ncbi:MAG: hypothetical protein ACSLE6_01450 [Mycobacterium sp.]
MNRWAPWLAAGLTATTLLSGCSSIAGGGDTPCNEFTAQSDQEQDQAVTEMLKEQNGTDPSGLEITTTREATQLWCETLGTPDSKIKEAPGVS